MIQDNNVLDLPVDADAMRRLLRCFSRADMKELPDRDRHRAFLAETVQTLKRELAIARASILAANADESAAATASDPLFEHALTGGARSLARAADICQLQLHTLERVLDMLGDLDGTP